MARAKHVRLFCTSYHSLKTLGHTTECAAVKLSIPIITAGVGVSL